VTTPSLRPPQSEGAMAKSPESIKVWLVTGCSSGLGRQLVSAILARGDKVIATARRISDLDYISSIDGSKERALSITLDVTEPYDQLSKSIDKAIKHFGYISVLVNNAGFVVSGVWEELR
jgi:NAD(P)-dependent dehydrogenase (short-subunit alcohol dehydrogenase family)